VTQLDQATQQNAALVEEMASAASSLNSQAQDLVQAVAVFRLDASGSHFVATTRKTAPTTQAAAAPKATIKPKPLSKPKTVKALGHAPSAPASTSPSKGGDEGQWESF
jgi:methyl-accepting chemotaxis protein